MPGSLAPGLRRKVACCPSTGLGIGLFGFSPILNAESGVCLTAGADEMISTASLSGKVDELLHTQVKDLHSPLLEEIQSLVDEIEHYRGELERENEELRKTRQHLEAYRARYVDLYDSAPLGYATLDQDGYLQEINLAGAKMLGADREALTGYSFR